ncbi:MAG TPA: arylamine N-acetyltransferase, partial [Verrucomicrobiae bacterium]|nr:arylamine N-acetyltransferase [Verrucomicrobiae bacterium]
RGGYCFEQNTLLAAVLERVGFTVTRLAARVRYYSTRVLPRLHMVLQVEAEGQSWLADAGFGGCGLLEAIPLSEHAEVLQDVWRFRMRRENGLWVLQTFRQGDWADQYIISPEPQLPVDYEVVNHYCSTHPDSRFIQTLTAQRPARNFRHILKNRELTTIRPDSEETRVIESEEALLEILEKYFDLRLPAGTRFRPTIIV